jgi:hypothetical protein
MLIVVVRVRMVERRLRMRRRGHEEHARGRDDADSDEVHGNG